MVMPKERRGILNLNRELLGKLIRETRNGNYQHISA
jgi:hypothetical protein